MTEFDRDRSMHLVELALDFSRSQLQTGRDFRAQVYPWGGSQATFMVHRSPASRSRSPELYRLAGHFERRQSAS